jgi:hypothetical protein
MASTSHTTVVRTHNSEPAPNPSRRQIGRVTVGFWSGGAVLGTGGCILGGLMPYDLPVAVAISSVWWGIYLGCFGASIGALLGLLSGGKRRPRPE